MPRARTLRAPSQQPDDDDDGDNEDPPGRTWGFRPSRLGSCEGSRGLVVPLERLVLARPGNLSPEERRRSLTEGDARRSLSAPSCAAVFLGRHMSEDRGYNHGASVREANPNNSKANR